LIKKIDPSTSSELVKKLLLLFLIITGLYFTKKLLIPLSIGAVLATLFLPFSKWMEVKKLPRALAVLICLTVLILAIAIIVTMLGWQIAELANDVAQLKVRAIDILAHVQQFIFNHFSVSLEEQSQILKDQQNAITGVITSLAGSLGKEFTNFILTLVYFFLLLYYRNHIKKFILQLSPPHQRAETEKVIYSATHVSQQYLLGLSKMIFCLWIMYAIGFSLLGIKNALFFAILCGLLEIVPFIGNITGTTVTVLVAAVDGSELSILVGIVITYGIVQLIQGWLLEPLILGPQVKINPLFTIIALVAGELLWGIPGIVLAIPLTAILKIVCDHIDSLKPYGFLIGDIENGRETNVLFRKKKFNNSQNKL
jgi:predicted PurR-regulated permease PerM